MTDSHFQLAKGTSLKPTPVIDLSTEEGTAKAEASKNVNVKPGPSSRAQPKNSKSRKKASKVGKEDKKSKYFNKSRKDDVCEVR